MPLLKDMEPIVKKFYDGVAEGKLYGRKCKECGAIEFPPHLGCNTCGYHETEWVELSGHGTLKSFVVPGIQNDKPYLKAIAPYGYGAVQLDEGPIYSVVVFAGKKKIVKGLQQRLADAHHNKAALQRLKEAVNHTGQEAGAHAKGGGEEHNRQHAGRGN